MDEGGGQQRKYNNGKDDGGIRKRWQDNNDTQRSGPSDSYSMWRNKKTGENNSGLRGRKPWGIGDCYLLQVLVLSFFTSYPYHKSIR
jgi:hypothetical protein